MQKVYIFTILKNKNKFIEIDDWENFDEEATPYPKNVNDNITHDEKNPDLTKQVLDSFNTTEENSGTKKQKPKNKNQIVNEEIQEGRIKF